jgi:hypothetical protein
MASLQELHSLPGVTAQPDDATKGFIFQQASRAALALSWGRARWRVHRVVAAGHDRLGMIIRASALGWHDW